jgi:hypothetical protein
MSKNPLKLKSLELAPLLNDKVQNLPQFKKNNRDPILGEFRGGKFWIYSFQGGHHFRTRLFLWILGLREIMGWQDG